jgi:hypothetical protein
MHSDKTDRAFQLTLLGVALLLSFVASLLGRLLRSFLGLRLLSSGIFDLSGALVDFAHGASFLVNGSPK